MLLNGSRVFLTIRAEHEVGFDAERAFRIATVTLVAVRGVMAAIATLGVVQGLYRVNHDPVGTMAFRSIVTLVVSGTQVRVDSATGVAVEAKGLLMALGTIAPGLAGYHSVTSNPVSVMVGRNAFSFVALAAF